MEFSEEELEILSALVDRQIALDRLALKDMIDLELDPEAINTASINLHNLTILYSKVLGIYHGQK